MSEWQKLRANPPTLKVKDNAREIICEMVSCMCDNRSHIRIKKNSEGDFRIDSPPRNGGWGNAMSNFQIKYPISDIEWAADDGKWDEVFSMINSGTELIESVKSR